MKQIRLILLSLLLLTLPLDAKELNLRILCWEGYAPEPLIEEFKRFIAHKYDIKLNVTVKHISDPQEFFDRIRAKDTDIISPSHHVPKSLKWRLIQNGLIIPINLNNIPNHTDIIEELKQLPYVTKGSYYYGIPLLYGPYGLAYNSERVDFPITSWQQLWQKEFKQQYAISSDYHEANIYITALALGYKKQEIFDYDLLRKDPRFQAKLTELATNAKRFWIGVDRADEFEDLTLGTAWGFSFPELKKRNQIWRMATPKEGTTGWVDVWSLGYSLKDQPQLKRIAEEWINFSLSPTAQVHYVRHIAQYPVNLSIKSQLSAQEIQDYKLDKPDYFKNNLILWKVLDKRQQNGFKMMWQKAKDQRAK